MTYVGGNGLPFRADGWCGATYNQNGVLYSALVNDNNYDQGIYSINTSTGAAALVHDFGIGHLLSGFVPIGTHLYSFDYINNAFYNRTNEIFDYTGGVLVDTHVAVTGLTNPLDSIIATAYLPTATPEPGSIALLASGGIVGGLALRRRFRAQNR